MQTLSLEGMDNTFLRQISLEEAPIKSSKIPEDLFLDEYNAIYLVELWHIS